MDRPRRDPPDRAVDRRGRRARRGRCRRGQRMHRLVPPLRDPPQRAGADDPGRPGRQDRRGGDRAVRRGRRRPGGVPASAARRRLPLRLRVDLGRPPLGGGGVRRVLPPRRIEPALRHGAVVTHVEFRGLDGFNSVVTIEDALDDDVLLADHLDGEPLGTDHGAPLRVVSPAQYGYISTKHLCRIDVHTAEPSGRPRSFVLDVLLHSHPRARVCPRGAPWVGPRPRGPAGLPSRRGGDAAPIAPSWPW